MSEEKQDKQQSGEVTLPIEWHIPADLKNKYATQVIVQHLENEFVVNFFEAVPPPFVGSPEENKAYLERLGVIKAECVGRIVVAADLMPKIIQAMQTTLDGYRAKKAEGKEIR